MAGISALPFNGGIVLRMSTTDGVILAELTMAEATSVVAHIVHAARLGQRDHATLASLTVSLPRPASPVARRLR